MSLKQLFVAVAAAFLILGNGVAVAGQTVDIAGAIACVNDKWTESESDKGHKLADLVQRCVLIPNDLPYRHPLANRLEAKGGSNV